MLINARLAADAAGATKMDRPEWAAVHPRNGEVYLTLTNNAAAQRPIAAVDAANPRFYNDKRTTGADQKGNPNGHIVRLAEDGSFADALSFTWDVFLFGARASADPVNVNLSGLSDDNDFSSPDGVVVQLREPRPAVDTDRRRRVHRRHQLHDAGGDPGRGRRRRGASRSPTPTELRAAQ